MKSVAKNAGRAALVALLAGPLLVAGCDRRDVADETTATPAEAPASPDTGAPPSSPDSDVNAPVATNAPEPADASETATPAGATSQADALALLATADEHEIAAADQALGKNVTGAVRDFAQMMKTDHGKNLTDTTKLGAANSTAPAVTALKDKGEADLKALDTHSGADYEKAYMEAMVKGHGDVLALIDNTLMPAATDASVREHFTTTRAAVARHLDKAKEIQATLK
jgi:putative membrane protein